MSNLKFNLVSVGDEQAITVFANGELLLATSSSHPNFQAIVEGALAGNESVVDLFDIAKVLTRQFESLSERVALLNGQVVFDGDPVDEAIDKQITRLLNEGLDVSPLVAFLENVMQNPNEHSRQQLYRWLLKHDFPITDDGCVIAYKGVVKRDDGTYVSIHAGEAFVDGVEFKGQIPNAVGSVVTMPRSDVQHDPSRGCHTGLHAGTWDYASNFAQGAVLTVRINPRDVVSVPTDCNDAKVRVCRYVVEGLTEKEFKSVRWADAEVDGLDEDEECCDICGYSVDDCESPDDCDGYGTVIDDDEDEDPYVPRHR